ncbi:MAG: YegP family protein [bacterium]|nr:YegP family protein [bacterium]
MAEALGLPEDWLNDGAKGLQNLLASEGYTTKAGAENGIASVKTNAPIDARYEKKTSTNGKAYFVLKAANHEIIGTSQMYISTTSRDHGIEAIKRNAPSAETKDLTRLI